MSDFGGVPIMLRMNVYDIAKNKVRFLAKQSPMLFKQSRTLFKRSPMFGLTKYNIKIRGFWNVLFRHFSGSFLCNIHRLCNNVKKQIAKPYEPRPVIRFTKRAALLRHPSSYILIRHEHPRKSKSDIARTETIQVRNTLTRSASSR
jgi:hypothetical protein